MIRSALDNPDVGASFETHYHVWEASENFFQTNNARRFNFFSPIGEKGLTFKIEKKIVQVTVFHTWSPKLLQRPL